MAGSHGREQDWVEWGVRGKVSGQSRAAIVRAAKTRVASPPGGLRPGGQRPSGPVAKSSQSPREREQVLFSEDLYSWWDGRKKLHIDYPVNVVPAFLGECDYPNLGMCGGLLARILILRRTPFVHLVGIQICDRRQLLKIGALSKVTYGLFL